MPSPLIDTVATLLAGIAVDVVMPRFRQLAASDVSEKSPGEIVTVVDRAVEAALIPALTALRSGSRVVGEEGVSENPDLLHGLDRGEVWVVDPIDGTTNFVHGREDFGIMVALLRDGEALMSWIQFPVNGGIAVAEHGSGAYWNGARLQLSERDAARPQALRGVVKTGFMPEPMRSRIDARAQRHVADRIPGTQSACGDYLSYARGESDLGLYWRMLPWDHAPGSLLLTEAGGHVARHDGSPYQVAMPGTGLLVARSHAVWQQAQRELLQP